MKILFVALFLLGVFSAAAQQPPTGETGSKFDFRAGSADSIPGGPEFWFGGMHGQPGALEADQRLLSNPPLTLKVYPWESETSVVQMRSRLPERIDIPLNTPRRIASTLWISNGQAWNWGAYPDAFLDARTISMPLPR